LIDVVFSEQVVDEWVEIWNNFNLDRVRELFLDDARVTYFSSEKQGLIKGIDSLVEHHREFGFVEGGKDSGNRLWLEDVEIEEFGDTVVVKADWIFQRKGSDKQQRGPVTIVYVKDDRYRIAHAHFSNY
jgi:ketosteroid isomerase-like protein